MAALRPTARLVTMATKPLGSISWVSAISTSSPLTSETETPISPAISALMPTSLSAFPFTVNESNAKLWAITPGLPALACAPVNIMVPKLLSMPVTITSGLGKPRTRIAALSRSQGSTLAKQVAAVTLVHHEAPSAGQAGAADRGVHLPGEQQPEAVPVVRAGEILVALALVAGDDLADVHCAPHPFHVGHDEDPEPRLVGHLLVRGTARTTPAVSGRAARRPGTAGRARETFASASPLENSSFRCRRAQQPQLGHLLDGVADALAALSRFLDPAVGRVVHPEAGYVVDHQPTHLDPLKRVEDPSDVVGEESSLDAVGRVVDRRDSLVEVGVRADRGHRREDLLAVDPHRAGGVEQHRGLEHRAVPPAAHRDSRPGCGCLGDPLRRPLGTRLIDHRTDVGRLRHRVSGAQRADRAHEALGEARVQRLVHQDPLGGDARLAGVEVSTGHAAPNRVVQVGVGLDHHGGVAAQLERHPLGVARGGGWPTRHGRTR